MKDIHGNPDLFDSLSNLNKEAKKIESLKHIEAAQEYASQGFEENQISELLKIDGCSSDVANELAFSANNNLPNKYDEGNVPQSYADVKKVVETSILSGNLEDLRKYFENHARKYAKVVARIIVARDNPTRIFIDEIHNELRPLVEGSIFKNIIEAQSSEKSTPVLSEKDSMEREFFGVWPTFYIRKKAQRILAEKEIIEASQKDYTITYNNSQRKQYKKKD